MRETPMFKSQIPIKFQCSISNEEMAKDVESENHVRHWNLGFGISLVIGIWSLDIIGRTRLAVESDGARMGTDGDKDFALFIGDDR